VLTYALLTTALFYLGSRAQVTAWLWSKYPPGFARFMDCAACSGFWYGTTLAVALPQVDPTLVVFTGPLAPILTGLCALVWTPAGAAALQVSLERVGSALPESEE
jgi:hypothetical protein